MHRQRQPSALDDSGPKPPPQYRLPPPPPLETHTLPSVPDVSLVFSPFQQTKSMNSVRNDLSNHIRRQEHASNGRENSPSPVNAQVVSGELIQELISIIKKQSVQIQRIEDQLQLLIAEKDEKKLGKPKDAGVQTEEACRVISQIQRKRTPPPTNQVATVAAPQIQNKNDGDDITPSNTQDLSKILQELQLPISTEASIYSVQNSSPHVDLPDFTDFNSAPLNKSDQDNSSPGIGPSVSEYGSTDEDDEIQPTATYYRNILGNVNRLLENPSNTSPQAVRSQPNKYYGSTQNGGYPKSEHDSAKRNTQNNNLMIQQNVYNSIFIPNTSRGETLGVPASNFPQLPPDDILPQWNAKLPTDTTLYGMSSANLSFATRDYLERHGLVQGARTQQFQSPRPSNRIFDSVLKNQPKFV